MDIAFENHYMRNSNSEQVKNLKNLLLVTIF